MGNELSKRRQLDKIHDLCVNPHANVESLQKLLSKLSKEECEQLINANCDKDTPVTFIQTTFYVQPLT